MTQPGPPSVPFDKLRLVRQAPAAELYAGVDEVGAAVTVVVLTPAGQADPAVREAFQRTVNAALYGPVGGPIEVQTADLAAAQPWAAAWTEPGVTGLLATLPTPAPVSPWSAPPPVAYPPPVAPAPRSSRNGLVLALLGVVVAIVLLGSATIAVILVTKHSPADHPVAGSSPAPSVVSSSPPSPAPADSGKPTLRAVPAHSLIGPTFGTGEATYTMAFQGWPFAFRTPKTWGCLAGNVDKIPDAKAWVCIDEGHPDNKEKANVMLRPCPTTCTQAERTSMNKDWFDDPGKAKQAGDDRTYLVETGSNSKGLYSVDLSRFFGSAPGQLTWQVGVYVEAPSTTKADVQKIINDVVGQTG